VKQIRAILLAIGVAFAAGKSHDDPDTLLEKIRSRTAEHLAQLPHYTCHEVISRLVRRGSTWVRRDTVEIEVAFIGHEEFFARSGEDHFNEKIIDKVVPDGTIGNGVFGSVVQIVFTPNVAEFEYAGSGKKDGRQTIRFNFKVPLEKSQFLVKHGGAQSLAPYEGSIWVDAETYDLVRVDLQVKQIPRFVGLRWIEELMHYETMQIGNEQVLLPRKSELAVTDDLGNYGLNLVELQQCREFKTDSVVKYGAPVEGSPTGSADRERPEQK
jgi:hypothetical protein